MYFTICIIFLVFNSTSFSNRDKNLFSRTCGITEPQACPQILTLVFPHWVQVLFSFWKPCISHPFRSPPSHQLTDKHTQNLICLYTWIPLSAWHHTHAVKLFEVSGMAIRLSVSAEKWNHTTECAALQDTEVNIHLCVQAADARVFRLTRQSVRFSCGVSDLNRVLINYSTSSSLSLEPCKHIQVVECTENCLTGSV